MDERPVFYIAFVVVAVAMYAVPYLIKMPFTPDQDIQAILETIESHVVAEDWTGVGEQVKKLQKGWDEMRVRIHFNTGPLDVLDFEENLSRLSVAAAEEDRLEARMGVAVLKQVWTALGTY